jgi:methionyl aminopeptidase
VSTDDPQEIAGLQAAGRAVAATLREVRRHVRPGVTTQELDEVAERTMARHGARSAPRLVYDFPGAICISVDDEAVHGIPGKRRLREGQLVKIDVTVEREGFFADAAVSVPVGRVKPGVSRLVATAQAALNEALAVARPGITLTELGGVVEAEVERRGARVLRELCGHGIGRTIHEGPSVSNWADPDGEDEVLTEGLVMTIEPIIAQTTRETVAEDDGWTISTDDGSVSAHAEHTLVVRDGRPLILTA